MNSPSAVGVLACAVLSIFMAGRGGGSESKAAGPDDSGVVGDWRGDSVCVVRESGCHNEDSLYHVTQLAEKPGWFSMKLDKIVDAKRVTMGTTECSYDSAKRALICEFPRGVFHLTIQADKMAGTMNLTDGALWRKISLKKSTAP